MKRSLAHIFTGISILLLTQTCLGQVYPVKVDRKWGLIDAQGELVAAPRYQAIHQIPGDHAIAVLNDQYGLLNSVGTELVPPQYTFLREINDELVLLNQGGSCEDGDCDGGLWGMIYLSDQTTLEPQFSLISRFDEDGFALVNFGGDCTYDDCEGGWWGLIDNQARIRIPAQYLEVVPRSGSEAFVKNDQGWGLFSLLNDSMQVPPVYEDLIRVGPNRLAMQLEGKFGVVNNWNKAIIPAIYDNIKDGKLGYLAYEAKGGYGLMDSLGQHITQPLYEKVEKGAHGWIKVFAEGRWGLRTLKDKEVLGTVLLGVPYLGPSFAVIQRGMTKGVINTQGESIVPTRYENIRVVKDSVFIVRDKRIFKWYDLKGRILRTLELTGFDPTSKELVQKVQKGKSWGVIDLYGKWVVPPKYEKIALFGQVAKAKQNGEWKYFYFDAEGNRTDTKFFVVKGRQDTIDPETSTLGSIGWYFSSGRSLWGLRNPRTQASIIPPTYTRVELVPGQNISIVTKREEGVDATGLVHNRTGREVSDFIFSNIESGDFLEENIARCTFSASGKSGLVTINGDVISVPGASYIGKFVNGVARVNVGGYQAWRSNVGMDTLGIQVVRDRIQGGRVSEYLYCEGGKWGFIDRRGEWLIEPKFETLLDFKEGMARVRQDGKWGAVNEDFEFSIKPIYDYIEYLHHDSDLTLLAVGLKQDGIGFVDAKGEIAISPRFGEAGNFQEGLVRVRENGLWGYADLQGNVVIEPRYKEACDFREGRARVRDRRYWGYIDSQGNEITPQKYLRAGDFHEGLAWVQHGKFFGYIGLQGKMLINPEMSEAGDFKQGAAPVKKKSGYGMIDQRGRWRVQPRFYRVFPYQENIAVVQERGSFGFVNGEGEFVLRPTYREIGEFSENLAPARSNFQFGYLSPDGTVAIDFQFPRAEPFSCGRAAVFVNGKWGFIDSTGTQVIPNDFSQVGNFHEDRAAVRLDGAWGFVDPTGRMAVPARYQTVEPFQQGRAAVQVEGSGWGFVNKDGTVVIPTLYEAVGSFQNGIVPVRKDGKWALLNVFGAPMTSFKYDEVGNFQEGLAQMKVEKRLGVVNGQGKVLLDPGYDTISILEDRIQVEGNDEMGYLDLQGNWIWKPTK